MKLINLNSNSMPMLGLGTWKSESREVYIAVKKAIEQGYRHIDCASVYGNEAEVGSAINDCIIQGTVKRSDLWVTSKLWNNSHGKDRVLPALKQTLRDLRLDYLDLYLIHWPVAFRPEVNDAEKAEDLISLDKQPLIDTWKGLEDAVNKGLVKNIGVSNFSIKKLSCLLDRAKIKPVLNQVELHPYFQQKDLVWFCHKNNIQVTAYSPLGSYDRPNNLKTNIDPVLLEDATIKSIANTNKISVAQVILAWAMQRGVAVIPKSTNEFRLKENLLSANIHLSHSEITTINGLDKGHRYIHGKFFVFEGGNYTLASLWDE